MRERCECAVPIFVAIDTHLQIFLDENGTVDFAKTKQEGEKVNASKIIADHVRTQYTASRRRRGLGNAGITPEIMKQIVSARAVAEETEFEGWVFATFLDCKVGESPSSSIFKQHDE